ncbi:hypothetical protein CLOM_g2106 [Closterium sp. NIES-68]|nr:hypothetical protein CLOM_g2106 [Closterium sp. NIES-68]GJP71780.1 hypothetical protein CLOP_g2572 [Closterium sp. NIES-67]
MACARIMHVHEVVEAGQSLLGTLVRVTGRIRPVAGGDNTRIRIEDRSGAVLVIDTSRIVTPGMRPNSLFQFLGELTWREEADEGENMVVVARLGRCVEGMDEGLFEKALELKRQYESTDRAVR